MIPILLSLISLLATRADTVPLTLVGHCWVLAPKHARLPFDIFNAGEGKLAVERLDSTSDAPLVDIYTPYNDRWEKPGPANLTLDDLATGARMVLTHPGTGEQHGHEQNYWGSIRYRDERAMVSYDCQINVAQLTALVKASRQRFISSNPGLFLPGERRD